MSDTVVMSREQISMAIAEKAWKDQAFHREVLADPNAAFEKYLGTPVPAGVTMKVLEDTPTTVHFVLPVRPPNAGELSDEELEKVSGGITFAFAMSAGAIGLFTLAIGGGIGVEAIKQNYGGGGGW